MGTFDLPERSDAAVLSLLDSIQSAGGMLPANIDPPFGRTPQFLVAFGTSWAEAHAALLVAEASEARGARVPGLGEANALTVAELKAEVASLRNEVKALSARKALPSLRDYSVAECCAAGYNAAQLRRAGFSAAELRGTFTAAELKAGGFTAAELRGTFTAAQLKEGGFDAATIALAFDLAGRKAAGTKAGALRMEGFDAEALKVVGFTAADLKAVDFDNGQLWDAGFRCGDSCSLKDYRHMAELHCGTCTDYRCCPRDNPFR